MSKVVITRKIPIRTVTKANNQTQQQPTSETPTTPSNEQPTSQAITSSTNNSVNTTTTTANNNSSQISSSTNNTSTTQPSTTNNVSSSTTTAQSPSSTTTITNSVVNNTVVEEDDIYNPKINYEEVEKQSIKFRKFSKAFVIAKKKEQVRFYLSKVEQIIPQRDSKYSIVPLSMCILYHRQNGGEYALCMFKDKKMIDLCPLTMEKTEIFIVLNPNQNNNGKQRSVLQILSENLQGMNVDYYLQFDSEVQLLSAYSAIDKCLMYNGMDVKESLPTFNSLLVTYSSRQMKDEVTSPRTPAKFKWCEKYVEQYSSSTSVIPESLRTTSTEKKQVKSFRKTIDDNESSSDSSYTRGRLSQTEQYSPVDDSRRRYLEEHDESLGSRHNIPSGDDSDHHDSGRRRHREAIIAKSSPIQSSPLLERKSEEERYRTTSNNNENNSDGESTSPTPKITSTQRQEEPQPSNTSPTPQDNSTTVGNKKVIKRVIKRVPKATTTE